jgi:hypothetical protein
LFSQSLFKPATIYDLYDLSSCSLKNKYCIER